MRILVDGRVDGHDGIGRYTRGLIAALRAGGTAIHIDVLTRTTTPRYSRAEGDELLKAARSSNADAIHVLDYRVPLEPSDTPILVTIHDVVRLTDPWLCYSDGEFAARFGASGLVELRAMTDLLDTVVGWPPGATRPPECTHETFYGRMLALANARASAIITPTRAVAGQLAYATGREHRVRVSHWGIDHPTAGQPATRSPGKPLGRYLLYVGQARTHKGLGNLLAAYVRSDAARSGVRLVFAGADFAPGGDVARQVITQLGGDAVPIGFVDEASLSHLYRDAEALVHLAEHEGFGFTLLEALAAGTRVIASDIPTLRETLGEHAMFADPTDSTAAARAIDRMLAAPGSPGDRERRRRWASRYSWNRHAQDMLALYTEVVG